MIQVRVKWRWPWVMVVKTEPLPPPKILLLVSLRWTVPPALPAPPLLRPPKMFCTNTLWVSAMKTTATTALILPLVCLTPPVVWLSPVPALLNGRQQRARAMPVAFKWRWVMAVKIARPRPVKRFPLVSRRWTMHQPLPAPQAPLPPRVWPTVINWVLAMMTTAVLVTAYLMRLAACLLAHRV